MSRSSSASVGDRVLSTLPYLLPLADALLGFGQPLLLQFPQLSVLALPLSPVFALYRTIPFAGLVVFLALFLLVVRNESLPHFLRYNTMQAILLDVLASILGIVFQLVLEPALGGTFVMETLFSSVFLGIWAASLYSIVQSLRGFYPEIPTLSDAVYLQVR
jgi:hypothetical protein